MKIWTPKKRDRKRKPILEGCDGLLVTPQYKLPWLWVPRAEFAGGRRRCCCDGDPTGDCLCSPDGDPDSMDVTIAGITGPSYCLSENHGNLICSIRSGYTDVSGVYCCWRYQTGCACYMNGVSWSFSVATRRSGGVTRMAVFFTGLCYYSFGSLTTDLGIIEDCSETNILTAALDPCPGLCGAANATATVDAIYD